MDTNKEESFQDILRKTMEKDKSVEEHLKEIIDSCSWRNLFKGKWVPTSETTQTYCLAQIALCLRVLVKQGNNPRGNGATGDQVS